MESTKNQLKTVERKLDKEFPLVWKAPNETKAHRKSSKNNGD